MPCVFIQIVIVCLRHIAVGKTNLKHAFQLWESLQASNGSDIYKMEEQLITVISSFALMSVLASSGIQLSSIEILAVEPASVNDVPGWWRDKVVLDSDSNLLAEGPAVVGSLAPSGARKPFPQIRLVYISG